MIDLMSDLDKAQADTLDQLADQLEHGPPTGQMLHDLDREQVLRISAAVWRYAACHGLHTLVDQASVNLATLGSAVEGDAPTIDGRCPFGAGPAQTATIIAALREQAAALRRSFEDRISDLTATRSAECCMPRIGEPSFVLLGRDAQAPALVERWACDRECVEPASPKPALAREIAGRMRAYRVTM